MNSHAVISLGALISSGVLLALVFRQGLGGKRPNQIFALYLVDTALVQIVYLMLSLADNAQQALLWYTLMIPVATAQPAIYFFFTRTFLGLKQSRRMVRVGILAWLLIAVLCTSFSQRIIYTDIYHDQATGLFVPELGPFVVLLAVPTLSFLGLVLLDLVKEYRNTRSSLQRARIQYLLLSVCVTWAGMIANGSSALRPYPIDVTASVASALLIAYSILQHQLLDIHIVVRKGLIYLISAIILGTGYFFAFYLTTRLFQVLTEAQLFLLALGVAVIAAVVTRPLGDHAQRWIDKALFRERYNRNIMIQRLSLTATSVLNLDELASMILKDVTETMNVRWAAFFLERGKDDDFYLMAQRGLGADTDFNLEKDYFLQWPSNYEKILTTDDLTKAMGQKLTELEKIELELLIPLKARGELIGALGIGPKLSQQNYSQDDKRTLVTLANQTAVAIDNARLYETVQRELAERKRVMEALQESEEMLRLVFENAFDGISVYEEFPESETRKLIDCNTRYAEISGYSKQDLLKLGNTLPVQKSVEPKPSREGFLTDLLKTKLYKGHFSWIRPDEKENIVEYTAVPVRIGGRILTIGVDRDITKQMQAEAEILRLQHLLQNITDSMPSVLITLDPDGRVLTWNPAAEALTGQDATRVQGELLWETCPKLARYHDLFNRVIDQGQVAHLRKDQLDTEIETTYRDVSVFPLKADGIIGAVLRIDDVTRRAQLEEVMFQSAKMASVGRLAAGVAHEINNPLSIMMQSAQVLQIAFDAQRPRTRERMQRFDIDPDGLDRYLQERELGDYLSGIRDAGERAAKIVTDLLNFSRKRSFDMSPHDLNELVEQTLDLAVTDYDLKKRYDLRNIEIVRDLAPGLPAALCGRQQIQQVVLNLVRNAAQAMSNLDQSDKKHLPRLTLRTSLAPDASFLQLEVEDNGPGIPKAMQARLFDPFSTTKDVGEGTGLGLWLCWSIIVERHNGRIRAESIPSQTQGSSTSNGTRFVIELPLAKSQDSAM